MDHGETVRLYDEHGRALLAYACALLRDPSVAEDVLHQVFLRLLGGRASIDGEPAPYLFRAIRNASLNHIRGMSREVELADGGVWLESPDASKETSLALQSALRTLPDEQREPSGQSGRLWRSAAHLLLFRRPRRCYRRLAARAPLAFRAARSSQVISGRRYNPGARLLWC